MPENFQLRPLQADDTDAVVKLYESASARDTNIGPITAAQWTAFVQRPHNRGGKDFRVAVCRESVIGLAESSLRDQNGHFVRFFKLVVEPAMRRHGVGTALLKELLSFDRSDQNLSLQTLAAGDWNDGISFLETLGFRHIESEMSMRCTALAMLTPHLPVGIVIERCETPTSMSMEVAYLHNAAFASDVAFRHYTALEMANILAENGQELWVIRDDHHTLGYCRLERETRLTWLEQIAIDPSRHGQGLGLALAYEALQSAGIDQAHTAGLSVSSVNGAARSMYQKLGFLIHRETRRYRAMHMDLNTQLSRNS